MRRLPLVVILLAGSISTASAAGLNVNWGLECFPDAPLETLFWACNSNSYGDMLPGAGGDNTIAITCSYALPVTKTNVIAIDVSMEAATEYVAEPIPDWWKLGDGECRGAPGVLDAITFSGVYGGSGPCVDYWQGTGSGGVVLYEDEGNRIHMTGTWAVPAPLGVVNADEENFAGTWRIRTAGTLPATTCGGCGTRLKWKLTSLRVSLQGEPQPLLITTPFWSQCAFWNAGGDCIGTPARASTWGQIKGLYR